MAGKQGLFLCSDSWTTLATFLFQCLASNTDRGQRTVQILPVPGISEKEHCFTNNLSSDELLYVIYNIRFVI
jgi:hypothetical protein